MIVLQNYFDPNRTPQQVNAMSALALAHIGDAVFELLVRSRLCVLGGSTNSRLHRDTVSQVCAGAQAELADRLLPLLTEEEAAYYAAGATRTRTAFRRTPRPRSTLRRPVWRRCSARCSCWDGRNAQMNCL